jgi:monothiol glutaredoxin
MSELRERIKQTIESEPVVVFIKGTPAQVMCGNSERALGALRVVGTGFTAVDILPDPQIRQELTALSNWPTIPQVFIRGELVGGADITEEMAESGELEAALDAELGEGWHESAGRERVAEVTDRPSAFRVVG